MNLEDTFAKMKESVRNFVIASCNLQVIDKKLDRSVPSRITGTAMGHSEADACLEAKRVATQSAPLGMYARHCQCKCSKG